VVIEAAFIYPIFLLLLFSALEFGLIMYVTALVDDAVTEGSRYGITGNTNDMNDLNSAQQAQVSACAGLLTATKGGPDARTAFLQCFVQQRAGMLCTNSPCVTVTPSACTDWKLTSCTPGTYGIGGQVVKYTVNYNWTTLSPLLMPFLGRKYPITTTTIIQNETF